MAGFYERVFKSPEWKPVAAAAFIFFAATVLCSVIAMFCFALYSRKTYDTPDDPIEGGRNFFAAALVALFVGVLMFVMFVLKNL